MATKLYYWAYEEPDIAPAPRSNWPITNGFVRRRLRLTQHQDTEEITFPNDVAGSSGWRLFVQLISDPLAAGNQFNSGKFVNIITRVKGESSTTIDRYPVVMYLCNSAGENPRNIIGYYSPSGWTVIQDYYQGILHWTGWISGSVNLTSQEGDRLVIELGYGRGSGRSLENTTIMLGGVGEDHVPSQFPGDTSGTVPLTHFTNYDLAWLQPPITYIDLIDIGDALSSIFSNAAATVVDAAVTDELIGATATVDIDEISQALEQILATGSLAFGDTSQSIDALGEIEAQVPLLADGQADEFIGLHLFKSLADGGEANEALGNDAVVLLNDAGLAVDASAPATGLVALADTADALGVLSAVFVALVVTDSGTAGEVIDRDVSAVLPEQAFALHDLNASAEVFIADTANAIDDIGLNTEIVQKSFSDSALAIEALTTAVSFTLSDFGESIEEVEINIAVFVNDSAAAISTLFADVSVALNEAAFSGEAIPAAIFLDFGDQATGDVTVYVPNPIVFGDSGSSSEVLEASSALMLPDGGQGIEAFTASVAVMLIEVWTFADVLGASKPVFLSEQAIAIDSGESNVPGSLAGTMNYLARTAPDIKGGIKKWYGISAT